MRRTTTLLACLGITAWLTAPSKADPIQGTVQVTVEPNGSQMTAIPYTYTGTIYDMANTTGTGLSGPVLGSPLFSTSPIHAPINADFDLTVTFGGGSSNGPSIDVKGTVTGSYDVTAIPQSNPLYAQGYNLSSSLYARGVATSATLLNWSPDSGVPISLINRYLNPAVYSFTQAGTGTWMASAALDGASSLSIDLAAGTETPEPATVLIYLAAIAGLGARRVARVRRSARP